MINNEITEIMNTEEKARAYDEALNWMRKLYPGLHGATKEDAEHYFPELRENEEERIRKGLVKLLTVAGEAYLVESTGIKKDSYLAYLEKQKEQKPTNKLENAFKYYTDRGISISCRDIKAELIEQKPAEWSEEDRSFYDSIICEVIKEGMHPTPEQAKWFKSLPKRFNLQPKQEWSEEDKKK